MEAWIDIMQSMHLYILMPRIVMTSCRSEKCIHMYRSRGMGAGPRVNSPTDKARPDSYGAC